MTTFGRIVLDGIEPVIYPAGQPIVGATLQVYITGGTTPASIFADSLGATAITNPQTSDSAGRFYAQSTTIWADESQGYDLLVTYPAGGSTSYTGVYTLGAPVNTSGFLANPNVALTGVPTAPTAAVNNASSQIATTQFVQNALNAISIVPSGVVQMFAMTALPSGWLVCNGAAVSRTTYAALFGAIGTTYGTGDGTTTFNLPAAQGQFIRIYNATGTGPDAGRALGALQLDQGQGHQHGLLTGQASYWARATSGGGQGAPSGVGAEETVSTGAANVSDGTNGTPRMGTETRPVNLNFVLAIKS